MPKIGGWSRRQDLEREYSVLTKIWSHDETGEILWISEKVPNDGYYVMLAASEEKFRDNRHANSKRYGYDPTKKWAKKIASNKMRDNPDGFRGDDE